jgi:hypothetical protein
METSLHRQLKEVYAGPAAQLEVPVDNFRIDVVAGDQLVEIQHGPLGAIRDKVRSLLENHDVLVVKPIVTRRLLVKQNKKGGRVIERRLSPKRGTILDLFDELVHFTNVFPHPRLRLEVPMVEVEEWRFPGHGRRRRRRSRDHQTEDQKLIEIQETFRFRTAADLRRLVPGQLPSPFHTLHLAEALGVQRWLAQKIAYCFRTAGTATLVGKMGNSLLYEFTDKATTAA